MRSIVKRQCSFFEREKRLIIILFHLLLDGHWKIVLAPLCFAPLSHCRGVGGGPINARRSVELSIKIIGHHNNPTPTAAAKDWSTITAGAAVAHWTTVLNCTVLARVPRLSAALFAVYTTLVWRHDCELSSAPPRESASDRAIFCIVLRACDDADYACTLISDGLKNTLAIMPQERIREFIVFRITRRERYRVI